MTITCAYHGWTYDVRDGKCVAVISEGPDSPVPAANIRAKTYPIEIRRGIVWIWMGSSKPVPVEDDIPNLLLDTNAVVKGFYRVKYGNWRFHAENVQAGHAQMVHKSTLRNWFGREAGTPLLPGTAGMAEDEDNRGVTANANNGRVVANPLGAEQKPYPGLGVWHAKTRWQRLLFGMLPRRRTGPVQGIRNGMLMLPGLYRQPNFPNSHYMYYEWYVPVDEQHYIYMQIMAFWPKNKLDRLRYELKYYFWDRPTGPVLFNNQDAAMVAATTKYFNRTGNFRYLTKISPNDGIDVAWRAYCDEYARGVGTAYRAATTAEAGASIDESAVVEAAVAGGGAGD
jgi:phenylpropionate dioxygenase-like ring-hydroxylating dioxygenase large terminal subunit